MLLREFKIVVTILVITFLIWSMSDGVKAATITGDVNGDGTVNILDIGIILDNYAKIPITNAAADLNHDGAVNVLDIGIVIDNYGKTNVPDPVVAAAGDIVDTCTGTSCQYYAVSDAILGAQPTAVLALGDLSNNSGATGDYTGPFGNSWGRFKSLIFPVPGNHDYGTAGAVNYYSYFGTAAHGPNGYYSFDLGNWHIVALNSNCTSVAGGCAAGSPQETWLKSDLAVNSKPCTLAFWHHPRYSSGHDGDNTFMSDIFQYLYNKNAEIVLSGHSHDYERLAPQNNLSQLDNARGIRQFVVGTGGAFWTGFLPIEANSQIHQNTHHGALVLTLHSNSYDWKFVQAAGESGTFTDSGTTNCH
jgi:acid phosphatase type 7